MVRSREKCLPDACTAFLGQGGGQGGGQGENALEWRRGAVSGKEKRENGQVKRLFFRKKGLYLPKIESKMVEKVIVSLDPEKRVVELFGSAAYAARAVGVSKQAICYALATGGKCAGRKWKRSAAYYLVKVGRVLAVCQKDGESYLDMGTPRAFKEKEVDKVVDVTVRMWEATL